ncbi:MAG: hypothetical protein A2Z14_16860 [Chloroflexi bacterium RBG_16_48_8]|nr:MAG: hypothetical protein A2Z14_16860 [Chloroflexi bacterium RBG_16_48_8]
MTVPPASRVDTSARLLMEVRFVLLNGRPPEMLQRKNILHAFHEYIALNVERISTSGQIFWQTSFGWMSIFSERERSDI